MVFVHLSRSQLQTIKSPRQLGTGFKPQGSLWFACGTAWEDWMAAEAFEPKDPYKYKYEANLDTDMLVVLKTVGDISAFSNQFAIPDKKYPFFSIDWNKVKKETGKSGIYIMNGSLKTARKKFLWYSTFDVCSVAIWDKNAIRSMIESEL
jgi:hypothetical protein